tara:strand:- start:14331 stop:16457 length:2127 start_codon:yes stop_codon:yes gene_type:complete
MHEISFLKDLAYILITAGLVSLIFKRFHQPVIVGYLVAGFLIGPNFQSFYNVSLSNIQLWADIGIVFLLFSLGLEFSFKKLMKTGISSGIAASIEIPILFFIGYTFGSIMEWDYIARVFLGGMLCISSTAIIYRSFNELNLRGRSFTHFVFGVLIFEDIVAILLLVLLPAFAVSQSFSGSALFFPLAKMMAFIILWFVVGIFMLPSLFRKIKKLADDELYVLLSLGLCFAMVAFSVYVGFSAALGAFVMGSLLAETEEKERIRKVFRPIRNLFAAIFFVSIGMLIAPDIIREHILSILVLSFLVLVGKTLGLLLGSLVAGQTVGNAILSASSMAQIGEFSFILAKLGVTKGLVNEEVFPIIVAVAIITTFITPYWIKTGIRLSDSSESWMPPKIKIFLARYDSFFHYLSSQGQWMKNIQMLFFRMLVFSVITFFIFLITKYIQDRINLSNTISILAALLTSAPFIWAMLFKKSNLEGYLENIIFSMRLVYTLFFVLGLCSLFFIPLQGYLVVLSLLGLFLMYYYSKYLSRYYQWYEKRFYRNYHGPQPKKKVEIAPWDIHISDFEVSPFAAVLGKSLGELNIRNRFGVTVASIKRGDINIFAPSAKEMLFPHDRLSLIGGDKEIMHFKEEILDPEIHASNNEEQSLQKTLVSEDLHNKSIQEAKIRQIHGGIIVGIEREDQRIFNPTPDFVLQSGDLMWLLIQTKRTN